jgi:hypothetical protein
LRRSKKQPEYDPSELADLIGTPAVGSGVGSHLLIPIEDPALATVVESEASTVVDTLSSTVVESLVTRVDISEATPIVPGRKSSPSLPRQTEVETNAATEVVTDMTTVATTETPSVDTWLEESSEPTTVVTSGASVLSQLWISESGEVVPGTRVHRVSVAADALSNGERALYELLSKAACLCETRDTRSVQMGYDSLTKASGFSRKTIQRTIDRLIAKHYIEIETPADIYRRTSTVYRVFAGPAVLQRLTGHGCTHVAKIGPGVAFVNPLAAVAERTDTVVTSNSATVGREALSTVDRS